jgi:hypothetical protein
MCDVYAGWCDATHLWRRYTRVSFASWRANFEPTHASPPSPKAVHALVPVAGRSSASGEPSSQRSGMNSCGSFQYAGSCWIAYMLHCRSHIHSKLTGEREREREGYERERESEREAEREV